MVTWLGVAVSVCTTYRLLEGNSEFVRLVVRESEGCVWLGRFCVGQLSKDCVLGSWDMYYFARRGRVKELHWMTLFILKQLQSVSYNVLGMI